MQLFIKKKIGKQTYNFVVEGNNLYDVTMESLKLSFRDIHKCGICGSDNLILNARKAQNKYKYVEIRCMDCKAALVFGVKKEEPDTYYLRKKDGKSYAWEKYQEKETALSSK